MTSAELLIYNCFIMLLCSLDNNGVAGVFLIIWLFPFLSPPSPHPLTHPPSRSLFFARYQGLQVIVEKIMTACLPACLFCLSWACASQTVSVQPESLAERAGGRVASYQLTVFTGPRESSRSNKELQFCSLAPGFVAFQ